MANTYFRPRLSAPTGWAFCDKTQIIPFTWEWDTDYTSYTIWSVRINIYNSSWQTVYTQRIDGNVTSCDLPADSISAYGFCWWRIDVSFNSELIFSSYGSFKVQEEPPIATPISPKNAYINGEEPNAFAWSHSISTGTDATRSDLQYSTNGNSWADLATVTGSALTASIAANTFSAGKLYWRVRTYNANNIAGEWSTAAECYVRAPVPSPAIINVALNTARPTFTWTATTQNAFELDILQNGAALLKSGVVINSSKSYKFNEFLTDGDYTARLRVYDGNGNYSEWTTYAFAVSTAKPDTPTLTVAQSGNDVVLTISNVVEENDCYILRDGKPIAKLNNPEPDYATHVQTDSSWHVTDSAGGLGKEASISGNATSGGTVEAPKTPVCLPAGTKLPIVGKNHFDGNQEAGTISTATGTNITIADRVRSKNYLPVLPSSEYTFSTNAPLADGYLFYYNSNKALISWLSAGTGNKTFTTPSNCKYVRFAKVVVGSVLTYSYQIEKGSVATTHEPYTNPTTLTVPCDLWANDKWNPPTGEVIHGDAVIENYNGEPIPSTYRSSTGNLMPQKQVTNEVVNGNFSNGTTGWAAVAGTLSVANNVLTVVGTGTTYFLAAVSQNISPAMIAGHKYYLAAKVKAKTASVVNMRLWADNTNLKSIVNPVVDTEYLLSDIFTYTGALSHVRVYLNALSVAEAAGATMEVRYIPLIDLTAAFGAGNEPTTAEMDARLASSFANGWFDGTGTLKGSYVVYKLATPTVEQFTPQPITLPQGVVNMVVESSNGVLPSEILIEYRLPPSPRTYTDDKTTLEHAYIARVVNALESYADSAEVSAAPAVKGYVLSNSTGTVNLKFRTSITDDFSNIGGSAHYTGGEYPDFEFSEFSDNSFNLSFSIPRSYQSDLEALEKIIKAKELTFVKSNYGDEMYCKITGYSKNPTKLKTEVTISFVRVNHSEVISYD